MNCIDYITQLAQHMVDVIQQQPNVRFIPTKNYGWTNHRFISDKFRYAHVEIFNQHKFCVLHCCVFPHIDDPGPIFGFDVITGENKTTGLFFDLSPTVLEPIKFTSINIGKSRDKPEWGDIFSPYWIACRPSINDLITIGNESLIVLKNYLNSLGQKSHIPDIIRAQNYYSQQQQKNIHTYKALEKLLGPDESKEFITQILFPTILT